MTIMKGSQTDRLVIEPGCRVREIYAVYWRGRRRLSVPVSRWRPLQW